MRISYKSKKVQQYCEDYKCAASYFGNVKIAKKLAELMTDLHLFAHIVDFTKVPKLKKYNLHDLVGDKVGIKSLSVDYSYRMQINVELYAETIDGEDEITILEVSKHYE